MGVLGALLASLLAACTTDSFAQNYSFVRAWPSGPGIVPLYSPSACAVDASGNAFVVCADIVAKVDPSGNLLASWGRSGSGPGEFQSAQGVALDSVGNVYVADRNNYRIQKFDSTGTYLSQWGSLGSGDGQFNAATSIAIDSSDNVYVSDGGNSRIQKFTSSGVFLTKWGSFGASSGQFNFPWGIATDGSDYVYVVDENNNRIQKFTLSGAFVSAWGSAGTGNGQFISPAGITLDGPGYVYISEYGGNRIQKFTSAGTYVTKWGAFGGADGQFRYPQGVAMDASGNVYAADQGNYRVQRFTPLGGFLGKWTGTGGGDGQFLFPDGAVVNRQGELLVADYGNHRIEKFSASGGYLTQWGVYGTGNGQFNYPGGVATDSADNVYVADYANQRIQKFTSSGVYLSQWGSAGSGNGQFSYPTDVVVDGSDNVYVADYGNRRIQKFGASGSYLTQWGGSGSGNGQFVSGPLGLAVDAAGNVYATDRSNGRIQKFSATGTYLAQWGSVGTGNGQFQNLYKVAADGLGNIYATEEAGNRVQKFTSSGGYITQWGAFGIQPGQFRDPRGIAVNNMGLIYVVDSVNFRVQEFAPSLSPPVITSPNAGADYDTNDPGAVMLTGTCDPATPAIHVNGSASGVTYALGSTTWLYTSGPLVAGTNTFEVTAFNGVAESAAAGLHITLDTTPPTVSIWSAESPITNVSPIPYTITFSESVAGFDSGDVTVSNGVLGNFSGSGSSYVFEVTPAGQDWVQIDVAAGVCTDAAGNPNAAADQYTLTYDTIAPVMSMLSPAPDPTNTSPISVFVYAMDSIVGFAAVDVTATNATVTDFTQMPTYFFFRLVPLGQGLVTADIPGGVCTDLAGNSNVASATFSRVFDDTPPTFSAIGASRALVTLGQALAITFTTSETLAGNPVVTVNGHPATFAFQSGLDYTYAFTVLGGDPEGPAAIAVTGTDLAGNSGAGSNATSLTLDFTPPQFTAIGAEPAEAIMGIQVEITFDASEPVDGDPEVEVNGHPATRMPGKTALAYRYTVQSPATDPPGPATIQVSGTDLAGNYGASTSEDALTIVPDAASLRVAAWPAGLLLAALGARTLRRKLDRHRI